jgi:EAL domain-containing protein (putative c-di-GMP-specific phosphodiesterase class I)
MFDISIMRLTGVEVLARLTDEDGQALPPDAFIPVAEETGMIAQLGRAVLNIACQDLAGWHKQFPAWRHLGVAVNVSARQTRLADLVADVRAALSNSGLAPDLLTVEITESVLLEADPSTVATLNTLQGDGVEISIDDFGTGYASLRYLAELPVSSVKVDRSFTAGLPWDSTSVTIVRAVAALARDLGITCVVEGIETGAQLRALPDDVHGQGFLLGRPLPAAQFSALLGQHACLAPTEVAQAIMKPPLPARRTSATSITAKSSSRPSPTATPRNGRSTTKSGTKPY